MSRKRRSLIYRKTTISCKVVTQINREPGSACNPFVWGMGHTVVERFLISVGLSGGKHADVQQQHVIGFLDALCQGLSPVSRIRAVREGRGHYQLLALLQEHRIGRYTLARRMLRDLAETPDVLSLDRDGLCRVNGFAMKSASMFKMYQDPAARVAVLNKCTLKWLGAEEPETYDRYLQVEQMYLDRVDAVHEVPAIKSFLLWFANRSDEVRLAGESSVTDARLFLSGHRQI